MQGNAVLQVVDCQLVEKQAMFYSKKTGDFDEKNLDFF